MAELPTACSRIMISTGCPSGIGPEVSLLAALRAQSAGIRCALVGDGGAIFRAASQYGVAPKRLIQIRDPRTCYESDDRVAVLCPTPPLASEDIAFGMPSHAGGRGQLAWIDFAVDLVSSGLSDAIVTGPVSKDAIARSGGPGAETFVGHTEHIARLLGAREPVMVFVADPIAVALVTTHLALADVPSAITVKGVAAATFRAAEMVWLLGHIPARVAVSSLNPHAGEKGLFGDEESTVISPAIRHATDQVERARMQAVIEGPMGAETAFRKAFDGHYDAVVAMYHDQGTIPMKVRCFGKAVNVTAGLPIIRTSVDHGTAYDIAGTGTADPSSMFEAICLADRLVVAKRAQEATL